MKLQHSLLCLFMITLLVVYGCKGDKDPAGKPSGKPVKIGFIGPFKGIKEEFGTQGKIGATIALRQMPKLASGDKPEILFRDDQNRPALTRKELRKLVEVDGVVAVMILSDSACMLAAAEIADELQTPILALGATHPDIIKNSYISQLSVDDSIQGAVSALYVRDELFKERVAVIRDLNDPHSIELANAFSRKFEEIGGSIETFSLGEEAGEKLQIYMKLKEKGIDFIYLPLSADRIILAEKKVRNLDYNPQVMVSDGVMGSILMKYEDDLKYLDGMLATEMYASQLKLTDFGKEAVRLFKSSYEETGTTFAVLSLEGTAIVLSALNRCSDKTDRNCINRALRSTREFTGYSAKISIKGDGSVERPMFINAIRNRNMNSLVKIY